MGKYDNINVVVEANNARKGYTQTYETIVLKPNVHDGVNVLTEEMFTKENAKYVIKWDYDLGGTSITIPENCIISMEGGSLTNGTLVGQNTKLINESGDESLVSVTLRGSWKRPDAHVTADEEDLTINNHNQIQLANKAYDEEAFSGMGRVYLRKNIVDGKNILDSTMMYEPNTIYVIQYDYDLDGETLEVPENCVLKFEGGSLRNGELVGNGTVIKSITKIFSNIICKGTYNCSGEATWFAEKSDYTIVNNDINFTTKKDVTLDLQNMLNSSFSILHFDKGFYFITNTLNVTHALDIVMEGDRAFQMSTPTYNITDKTVIFTNANITVFNIDLQDSVKTNPTDSIGYKNFSIKGGNIDVAFCANYSSDVIIVDISKNQRIWGLSISTNITNKYHGLVMPTGRGIYFKTDSESVGFCTMIRINSVISDFLTGVHVHTNGSNWITDVIVDGEITQCPVAINSNMDIKISASIQPGNFWKQNSDDTTPLIELAGGSAVVSGMIWDVGAPGPYGYRSNNIAIHIGNNVNKVSLEGKTGIFYNAKGGRISGDITKLSFVDAVSYADRNRYVANTEFNYFESILDKGATYSVKGFNSEGIEQENSLTIYNIKNVFSCEKSNAAITYNSGVQLGEDGYIEFVIEGFEQALSFIGITMSTQAYDSILDFGFGSIDIEVYGDSSKLLSKTFEVGRITECVKFAKVFGLYSIWTVAIHKIIFRFKDLTGHNILPLQVIGNPYALDGNSSSYLPISGGTVYDTTNFKKDIKIGTLPITLSKSCNGNLAILNEPLVFAQLKNSYSSTEYRPIFKLVDADNPSYDTRIFSFSMARGGDPVYWGIYAFNFGNGELNIYKIIGNCNIDFKVYKNSSDLSNFAICIKRPSNTYSVRIMPINNGNGDTVIYYPTSTTVSELIDAGYIEYNAIITTNVGNSSSRPVGTPIQLGFNYFDTSINKSIYAKTINYNNVVWVEFDGATAGVLRLGITANRPVAADIYAGFQYYDTTLGAMITWNGSYWVNENGFHAAVVRGELADRPTSELTAVDEGYQYYATDVHKAVYFSYNNGSPKWYYADGTEVQ